MASIVFNIAKGAAAEKVRDDATKVGILLLKTAEADATLRDYATVAAILAAGGGASNVEATFTNYARKTSLTATLTVDNTLDEADVTVANQTWTSAGGATNNTLVKAIFFYEETASDAGRVPLSCHDFAVTTDGSDLILQVPANGFYGAT